MAETTTHLPSFCYPCQYGIVHGIGFTPADPWQSAIIVVQLGLFQAASRDERVWARCSPTEDGERDVSDLSLVLAEIGCLGCFKPKTRNALIEAIGREGLSAVAQRVKTEPMEDLDA